MFQVQPPAELQLKPFNIDVDIRERCCCCTHSPVCFTVVARVRAVNEWLARRLFARIAGEQDTGFGVNIHQFALRVRTSCLDRLGARCLHSPVDLPSGAVSCVRVAAVSHSPVMQHCGFVYSPPLWLAHSPNTCQIEQKAIEEFFVGINQELALLMNHQTVRDWLCSGSGR